ncbi:aminodeoxychorismate synthase component I [Kitasatospora sp. NPDC004240]
MKTLLIDNYDSYTYNLYQLIARTTGVEPEVVTNDSPDWTEDRLTRYDNIVISPGPGDPTRPEDFGISARAIERAEVPVLGVCLGHQGIAGSSGAPVVRAPRARHGHLSPVTHDGRDLFAGIPQGFTVVRYHSLCIEEPLPPQLEATAWAEDGVLMGLRHRERPLWGVQFHPESVATEFGSAIVANFHELTRRFHAERGRVLARRTPGAPKVFIPRQRVTEPAPAPAAEVTTYRLHTRTIPTAIDTEQAFGALYRGAPDAFWLDSSLVEPGRSRFSFLGDASGPLSEVVRHRVEEHCVEVTPSGRPPHLVAGDVFEYLGTRLRNIRLEGAPELPMDLTCGYVGYLGYEMKDRTGSPAKHRSPAPDACWIFADRMVAVDHALGQTHILALSTADPACVRAARTWLADTAATLTALPRPRPQGAPAAGGDPAELAEHLVVDREAYLEGIETCKQQLLAGESYEICLTNAMKLPRPEDGYEFYQQMRRHNPAPYSAFLRFGELEVACSSPERFLKITRDRMVETKPIKGTARRGAGPAEDQRLRDALTTSAKTRAENLMIVDLLRNDLGRVCEVGSVSVPSLMHTETYATVHQLVSTIVGKLRADSDPVDCVKACFPGGSMTGAPKLRTMDIIDSLETRARGVYSGTIGFLGLNGTADLNIVIRTAVLTGDEMTVGAGGAIILDSDPVEEYEEMLLKASAPLRALTARPAAAVTR